MHEFKACVEKIKKKIETFYKSVKIHVKCVLKTEKSSFDKKFLSYTFNTYFI